VLEHVGLKYPLEIYVFIPLNLVKTPYYIVIYYYLYNYSLAYLS